MTHKSLPPVTQAKSRENKALREGPLPRVAMWRSQEVPVSTIQTMHLQGPCKQEAAGRLQNNVTAYCAVHLVYRMA